MAPSHRNIMHSIKSVQASAASLHDRTQFAGAAFAHVARALSELHDAIRKLRIAAEGPSALPRGPAARLLLTSLVMNCDMSLNQLTDMLEEHPSAKTGAEKSIVAFLHTKLVRQRVDIDLFLAAVQKDEDVYSGAAVSSVEPELWQCFFTEICGRDSPDNASLPQTTTKKLDFLHLTQQRASSPLDDEPKQWHHYISTADILLSDQSRSARLEPDGSGREISPDATWTRLDRRLISAQVLEQAGLRYEARRDSVSVLGTLSPSQMRELAERSAQVRQGRALLNSPAIRPLAREAEKKEAPFRSGLDEAADRDAQRRRTRRHRHRHRSRSCHSNETAKKEAMRMRDLLGVIGSIASVVSLAKEFA
ncbi:hypothetical protein L249_7574 [Ophiocordyceps polyrhachis-furcata BCC 54312]|uniref:DUF8035 domain-containing protein n=1 Tax=Ophiocordyceps polyrhachis-furcata BCC 54312 TaxID=1330021 RepID=A0A367LB87_9HYPO|nr:hypothetical protein L249_7574 [Ophiocordyceps polyrhachis-furcata BCC 54312]